jgi:hypothetical protein
VTAYYLWLPFLLTICFGCAKVARSLWRNVMEGGLLQNIIGPGGDPAVTAQNFIDFRPRYNKYHFLFGFCEFLNVVFVVFSIVMTDALLLGKFWHYGREVLHYIWSVKHVGSNGQYLSHDPMCELFPTEVACYIRIGATTGSIDRTNYLCILSNNLFNQKYFLVLWLWWFGLIIVSVVGLVYRLARLMVPDLSRSILMRKVRAWRLEGLEDLSSGDCFVLDLLADNLPHPAMDRVLEQVAKRTSPKLYQDMLDNTATLRNNTPLRTMATATAPDINHSQNPGS